MMDFDTGVSVAPPPSSPSIASLSSRALQAREEIHTTGHRFSPEFDLLLACVACDKSARTENVREAICSNLEWQTLLRITGHHRLIPQMYSALCDVANLVPADVLDKLRCRYQANVRQTLRLTRDLIRVLHHFESRAIPVLAYKGPALASILHGDFAQRQFADIDLLVHPSDVRKSKAALVELGYISGCALTDRQEESYIRSGYEFAFDLPDARNVLELKWRILPRFYSIEFDVVGFFDRSVTVEIGGHSVQTLSPEDLLLVLCVHAAKHAWSELSLLWDISRLIQSQPINWDRVREQAGRLGVCRILDMNLALARNLLGMASPLSQKVEMEPTTIRAVRRILPVITGSQQVDTESTSYFRLMIGTRERWRDRTRFLLRLAFTPNMGEWAVVRLPSWLFPLYHLVRMYRLSARLIEYLRLRARFVLSLRKAGLGRHAFHALRKEHFLADPPSD
jgi:hypothetical protein